eukprot:TRINITY_DN2891_c0_g1_i3.p1 TRINITY_DN2891_c0_g1~~TRINITY_DN2891_c0_g1_i3.p1  ORF type:complete len:695 (+),score=126.76 TRINITY_DN2891_c0_g1_i3:195-2087(+)
MDQVALSLCAFMMGTCLAARGFDLMKLAVVLMISLVLSWRTWAVACQEGQAIAGSVSALVVAACAAVFAHRLYPMMVFSVGCMLGGGVTYLFRTSLGLDGSPAALLGFLILTSVFSGLVFKHYRILGWRILTPMLGGVLAAASMRFGLASIFQANPGPWLDFTKDLTMPSTAVSEPIEIFFLVSWAVSAMLGWYAQLAFFVLGEDPLGLPSHLAHRFQQMQRLLPVFFDLGDDSTVGKQQQYGILQGASMPFLEQQPSDRNASEKKAADYGPECVAFLTVSSVLILNVLMMNKPLLFLGHVVLMSSAFLPFMTAGLMSYASVKRVLPGLPGPSQNPLLRHFTHATFNMLVLFCAVGGYLCIYCDHALRKESQIGWSPGTTWNRTLHAWLGYAILGLLFLMTFTGAAKMFAGLAGASTRSVAGNHALLGRILYGLAAFNQILAYFFRDLIPLWASVLLTGMLLCAVGITLQTLQSRSAATVNRLCTFNPAVSVEEGRSPSSPSAQQTRPFWDDLTKVRSHGERDRLWTSRLESMRSLLSHRSSTTASSGSSGGDLPGCRGLIKRGLDWESVLDTFEAQERMAILASRFAEWHRHTQSMLIARANANLQGSDNLVDFLSSALVQGPRCMEEP